MNGLLLGFGTSSEKEIADAVEKMAVLCRHMWKGA